MKQIQISELRKNLKEVCDDVYSGVDYCIRRKNNENVVIMSIEHYNNLVGKKAFEYMDDKGNAVEYMPNDIEGRVARLEEYYMKISERINKNK